MRAREKVVLPLAVAASSGTPSKVATDLSLLAIVEGRGTFP